MESKNTIVKYYKKHSLNFSIKTISSPPKKSYNFFVVIPAYDEYDFIFNTLDSINSASFIAFNTLLVIIVVNNTNKDSKQIKENNHKTYQLINKTQYAYDHVAIDCYSASNALKQKYSGVGFARKVGMDYALQYSFKKSIIFSLDADTLIDARYFEFIINDFQNFNIEGCTINFKHQKSNDTIIEDGIRKYEKKLKEIAFKMNKTGSPYGYVSMGSAMAFTAQAYIKVGGMPNKKATEDFYYLQALAKYTHIHQIKKILVYPSSRNQQRVYLGTGYRINEYKENLKFINLSYSLKSYENLKIILKTVDNMWDKDYSSIVKSLSVKCDEKTILFLEKNNFKARWDNFGKETKNKKQFLLFFNQWFDALKTIKFLKNLS